MEIKADLEAVPRELSDIKNWLWNFAGSTKRMKTRKDENNFKENFGNVVKLERYCYSGGSYD